MIQAPAGGEPQRLLFLSGAWGNTRFWQPMARQLLHAVERIHLGWPDFGDTPPDPGVRGFEDLLALLPNARLQLIPGDDHDLGLHPADQVAPLLDAHLIGAPLPGAPAPAPP